MAKRLQEFRERIAATVERCNYPEGVRRQIAAIISTGAPRRWTKKIAAPSLVVHSSVDPLAPMQGGLDIAATIALRKLNRSTAWATTCRRNSFIESLTLSSAICGRRKKTPARSGRPCHSLN